MANVVTVMKKHDIHNVTYMYIYIIDYTYEYKLSMFISAYPDRTTCVAVN